MSGSEQSCELTIFPGLVASVVQAGNLERVARSVSTFAGRGAEADLNGLCDSPEDSLASTGAAHGLSCRAAEADPNDPLFVA